MSIVFADIDTLQITRKVAAKGWRYFDGAGKRIIDRDEIDRLNAIALPPAYQNARYSSDPAAHIQAYGLDARGRRQYRYHPDYRARQDAAKYDLCADFGRSLPQLRKRVQANLGGHPLAHDSVLAAIVRIMDSAYLRVGNEQYARANKSFGVTTLRNRHARVQGQSLMLKYRSKGGLEREVKLSDRALARIVRRCQDLPGQALFQYRDENGETRRIHSHDVNDYIREASGGDFTAKHFRTWGASVVGLSALMQGASLGEVLDQVSTALGNTPAIARKSYIHPKVVEAAKAGRDVKLAMPRGSKWLDREERALLAFLERGKRKRAG